MHFRPVVELGDHRERKELDPCAARRPVRAALVIMVEAERRRAGDARNARLLERLVRGRLVRREPADRIAFGHDPAACLAGGDQQDFRRSVSLDAIGERGNLFDRSSPFLRTPRARGRATANAFMPVRANHFA